MENAVIFNSIEDARHFIKAGLNDEMIFFSTYPGVDFFLSEIFGRECKCLSEFVQTTELRELLKTASDKVDFFLSELDNKIAPEINDQLKINMKYFTPLYSYYGKYHLSSYIFFRAALRNVIDIYKLKKIFFYNRKLNIFIDTETDIEKLISLSISDIEFQSIERFTIDQKENKIDCLSNNSFYKRLGNFLSVIKKNIKYASLKKLTENKQTVLIYEHLYNLEFILEKIKKYNIILYRFNDRYPINFKVEKAQVIPDSDFSDEDLNLYSMDEPFAELFVKDIMQDFDKNYKSYFESVVKLKEICSDYNISLGIWGNPPVNLLKSLVFEYLRSIDIKVLGSQHGSVYGDSYEPWHFDSDFKRCDYFLSYGFTEEDLKSLYPGRTDYPEIIPLGMRSNAKKNSKSKKKIDLLFPITNGASIFDGGSARILPHSLMDRQIKLLEYLNRKKSLLIYVKPLKNSDIQNCPVYPIFKRLKNLNIIMDVTLNEFLEDYDPGAVLIEYPSQPLFDVINLDTEIFLMNDPLHPFFEKALDALKRRVYFSEDVYDMIEKIELFFKKALDKKRDETFLKHYVSKPDTDINILRTIDKLVMLNDKSLRR